jgi:ABC-2 type transport system permease protein
MSVRFPRTTLGWKWRAFTGSLALDPPGTRIGKILSLLTIIAFAVGATFFFRGVFANLLKYEGIGEPLLWRIIGITLTTVFMMLVISNLITGIATVYRSPEIPFLLARPVPIHRLFLGRFFDNLVYSSWSLAALGAPLVIAWGWVFRLPFGTITAVILFGLVPLVVISAAVSLAILMGLVALAHRTSSRFAILMVTALALAGLLLITAQRRGGLVVEGAARSSTVERYLAGLERETRLPLAPSQWMSGAMRAIRRNDLSHAAFLSGLLSLTALVALRWLTVLAEKVYYRSWTAFSDIIGRRDESAPPRNAERFNRGLFPNPLNAMLHKDLAEFTRNPSQWAQFLMLLAFLLVYLANLIWVSSRFNFDNPQWKVLVMFLNFAFSGFILATLSVRFVYPLISLEGRSFWVIRGAPVSVKLLFWEKFFLAFVVFMGLCELIVFISNRVLHVSGAMMTLTTVATFLMGATLTGLAIGLGAAMPDFKEESPMRIASTPGGVLTVILSLVYVGLMVAILAWPTEGYFRYLLGRGEFPAGRALRALILVAGLNLLALAIPLRLGQRRLAQSDL